MIEIANENRDQNLNTHANSKELGKPNSLKILGIDPGLNHTGWGIIRASGNKIAWVAHGVINPDPKLTLSERLGHVYKHLKIVVETYKPDEAAIEETFFANSAKTSLLLGHARGAAMTTLSACGLSVNEYATRLIKKAVVGTGTADKAQVAFMINRLLPNMNPQNPNIIDEKPKKMREDASDALAVAICHFSLRRTF